MKGMSKLAGFVEEFKVQAGMVILRRILLRNIPKDIDMCLKLLQNQIEINDAGEYAKHPMTHINSTA